MQRRKYRIGIHAQLLRYMTEGFLIHRNGFWCLFANGINVIDSIISENLHNLNPVGAYRHSLIDQLT